MVFALDVSGFYQEFTSIISGWLTNGQIKKPIMIKPFCCSLCMTFWLSMIYLLVVHQFTLGMIVYTCAVSYLTSVIKDLMILVKDTLTNLITIIYNKINSND